MVLMANRYILPAAYKYQGQVAESVAAVKAAGAVVEGGARRRSTQLVKLTDEFKAEGGQAAGAARARGRRRRREAREVLPRQGRAGDGHAARDGRQPRGDRAARPLAAADLPGDAVHQVGVGQSVSCTSLRGARIHPGAFFLRFCYRVGTVSSNQTFKGASMVIRQVGVGSAGQGLRRAVRGVGLHFRRDRGAVCARRRRGCGAAERRCRCPAGSAGCSVSAR